MKPMIVKLPLDKMSENKIDHLGVVVLNNITSVWVSEEEDIPRNITTGRYVTFIEHDDQTTRYTFDELEDAIDFANGIVETLFRMTNEI